jgi:hypothetical protein
MRYIIDQSILDYNDKSNTVMQTSQLLDEEHKQTLILSGAKEITTKDFNIIQRKADAWNAANDLGNQMDANARTSLLYLLMDPACPQWRKDRILAVQAWWSNLWLEYGRVIGEIAKEENGQDGHTTFVPETIGNCPYTIWQIATES